MKKFVPWLRTRRPSSSGARQPQSARLRLEPLETRTVPSAVVAAGADAGGTPVVTVLDRSTGAVIQNFLAYNQSFTGGVRVAVADLNGDKIPDIVTAPGPGGGPDIRVFDGKTGTMILEIVAYNAGFTGGVNVAVGDVNGDGVPDIITGAGAGGGPHVKVFDGKTGGLLQENMVYNPSFTGGVNVAAGDVNGDGKADIVTGAGPGGGPHVKVFDGITKNLLTSFFPYNIAFTGGVSVAATDLTADGKAEVITGAGPGGGPQVEIFNGLSAQLLSSFFAYDPAFTGGVRVGAFSLDAAGQPGIVTAPGPSGGTDIRIFNAPGGVPAALFTAFDPGFHGGSFVAASGLPAVLTQLSGGTLGNFFSTPPTQGPTLISLQLSPLNINLLGLQVQTSPITVTVSVQTGDGLLLGNLLSVVSNLVNVTGVNAALNNVLGNVVTLLNSATLNVNVGSGTFSSHPTQAITPLLDLFVAPVHANLLGAVVDTSAIHLTIQAQSGNGLVLGNVLTDLANLFNPPLPNQLNLDDLNMRLQNLINELNAQIPNIPGAPFTPASVPTGSSQVLALTVPPIDLNLLGLVLQTSQIQVNADAQTGNGDLLGNVLTTLLNTLGATPQNLTTLSNNLSTLLAKVVGVLNASTLTLASGAVASLTPVLQLLAGATLVNANGSGSAPVLNLAIASTDGTTPPVDVNLLGLVVTTSNIQAQLTAQIGDGQILGNLVYNVSHLLDPGGSPTLLTILQELGL